MTQVDFWLEYGSSYAYLSVMRVEEVARKKGVEIIWRPFLLMPIFVKKGMDQGPFLPFADKLAYMWRDIERQASKHGIPFVKPSVFPPNSLMTARVAMVAAREGWCGGFSRGVFGRHWSGGPAIGSEDNLRQTIRECSHDPDQVLAMALADNNKLALRAQTERAETLGIFGAPSFTVGDELFWGDDRLENAIDWALMETEGAKQAQANILRD